MCQRVEMRKQGGDPIFLPIVLVILTEPEEMYLTTVFLSLELY